jgi:hypothetical protein
MKWKYETTRIPVNDPQLERELNAFGAQGWELVNFDVEGEDMFCIFKMPV